MLTRLSIRNVVLIEALDLDFAGGLGVLTGETGAGKSILLDALGLVLGARADSGLVRAGEDQASVTASFEFGALPRGIATILAEAEFDVEPGEPLLIKRRVKADGGSKAFVNDQPVSAALLRELAGHLVELHGQHDDRGLVNPRGHRALLDRFARADVAGVEAAWDKWRTAREALDGARAAIARAAEDRDLLLAHLAELTALEPHEGEEEQLAEARAAMQKGEKLTDDLEALRGLWVLGNEYLQEAAPWTAIKTDPERAAVIVRTGLNLAALYARVSAPFIPFAAEKITEAFGEPWPPTWPSTDARAELSRLEPGRAVRAPEVLFRKIEDAQVAEWTARFGGDEA